METVKIFKRFSKCIVPKLTTTNSMKTVGEQAQPGADPHRADGGSCRHSGVQVRQAQRQLWHQTSRPKSYGTRLKTFITCKTGCFTRFQAQTPLFFSSSRLRYASPPNGGRNFSTNVKVQSKFKVLIAGAAGGIGQPMSLLIKQNPLVSHLALYDIVPMTPGVGVDVSHLDFPAKVTGHTGPTQFKDAAKGSHLVVIPAGVPRHPGMTRDDLFNSNAGIVQELTLAIAEHSPNAIIAIITNPINSMVPVASEVLKKAGVYNPKRVLGVTTLDVVRAASFIGEINGVDPRGVSVPVIGGHSGVTIIPVLSQCKPPVKLSDQKQIAALTGRIQEAGTEVVKAKAGGGSATLSMAYAGARITGALLKALNGESNIVECAYVKSDVTEASYFACPVLFGTDGIDKVLGYGTLNKYEQGLLRNALPELMKNIQTGEKYVHNMRE